jgi:hypothetical protein
VGDSWWRKAEGEGTVGRDANYHMRENGGSQEKKESATRGGNRVIYRKPSFRYEKVFETLALACIKVVANVKTCRTHNKS